MEASGVLEQQEKYTLKPKSVKHALESVCMSVALSLSLRLKSKTSSFKG